MDPAVDTKHRLGTVAHAGEHEGVLIIDRQLPELDQDLGIVGRRRALPEQDLVAAVIELGLQVGSRLIDDFCNFQLSELGDEIVH